ncbi:cupin domain-containing protein [Candidatus Electrothrix sp.]|uniref:cupin domain-containing protein n=1 Tax=Candidatus Electrothrix sp. TaxID=2170559 RepID=UPI00405668E4
MENIFSTLPSDPEYEVFDELLHAKNIRIERIVSKGHVSPETGWYDQEEHEWVLVLEGAGTLLFAEDKRQVTLRKGDYLHIPAHTKHKVIWTEPEALTVWLAVHYGKF